MSHANTSHQPTAPTITVTRSSLSPTPSRFLDLPLEIQRNILEKVYEGSYVLKAQNAVLNGVSWLGGPPLAPLRTCWHVYREGLPFYRKACYHLDVSDVHVSRIDTTVSTKGRSWISSVFREVTMHYSGTYVPSSLVELLLRPYTNLQTIRLITTDCSITSSRQVKDACQHAEDVLNRPCVISIAEWCVKTFTESSVPPSFRNLVKQITFIEYVGAVEDWAHHWAEFKVVSFGTSPHRCVKTNIVDDSVLHLGSLAAKTPSNTPMPTAGRNRLLYHLMSFCDETIEQS